MARKRVTFLNRDNDRDDDYQDSSKSAHDSKSKAPKTTRRIRLGDNADARRLFQDDDDTPLIDKILETYKPRPWILTSSVRSLRTLLRTCTLDTIPSHLGFYKEAVKQLDSAAATGNALNWAPGTDYKAKLPSYVEMEAIRIVGGITEGLGKMPSLVMGRVVDARLDFLVEDPANRRTPVDPFWITRAERDYPAIKKRSRASQSLPKRATSVFDDSFTEGPATYRASRHDLPQAQEEEDEELNDCDVQLDDPYDLPFSDNERLPTTKSRRNPPRTATKTRDMAMVDNDDSGSVIDEESYESEAGQFDEEHVTKLVEQLFNTETFHLAIEEVFRKVVDFDGIQDGVVNVLIKDIKREIMTLNHEFLNAEKRLAENTDILRDELVAENAKLRSEIERLRRQVQTIEKHASAVDPTPSKRRSGVSPILPPRPRATLLSIASPSPDATQPTRPLGLGFVHRRTSVSLPKDLAIQQEDTAMGGSGALDESSSLSPSSHERGGEKRRAPESPVSDNKKAPKIHQKMNIND
ncbi:hypothetical protein SCUP515_03098 [Seiridium cupressi]